MDEIDFADPYSDDTPEHRRAREAYRLQLAAAASPIPARPTWRARIRATLARLTLRRSRE